MDDHGLKQYVKLSEVRSKTQTLTEHHHSWNMYEILLLNTFPFPLPPPKKRGGIIFDYVKFYVTKIFIYIQPFFFTRILRKKQEN